MEELIAQSSRLFEDQGTETSPPLPAAPADEPEVNIGYGSSYTQIITIPPEEQKSQETMEDFSPQLPARPEESIHPSRRTRLVSEEHTQLPSIADPLNDSAIPDLTNPEDKNSI
jgi:hypothetical protein